MTASEPDDEHLLDLALASLGFTLSDYENSELAADEIKRWISQYGAMMPSAFSPRQKDLLAESAEQAGRQKMTISERGRFDQDLDEGAVVFTAPEFARKPSAAEGRKLLSLEKRSRDLANDVAAIATDLQRRVDVNWLLILADQLHVRAEAANKERGKRPDDGRLLSLVFWLAHAWKIGARRSAGTSTDKEGTSRVGPFVNFVRTAAVFLEPDAGWESRSALGDSVQDILQVLRSK